VFGSLGWLEIGTLLVVALLVFGPDKLPSVARDAARLLRELRSMAQGARSQLKSELGPEFADFDLDSLNPRAFVRKHLLEDEDLLGGLDEDDPVRPADRTSTQATQAPQPPPPKEIQPTPFDSDAT
jgi:sec-independent protein translocase protein TatB